jgi:flagellar motor switch protein FliM
MFLKRPTMRGMAIAPFLRVKQPSISEGIENAAAGEELTGASSNGSTVDTFDLRRPERIAKSQLNAILLLHENFVRSVVSSLSAYLRTYVSMNLIGVEQLSYSEFLEKLPATTCLTCLAVKPFEGSAILEINPALIFPILEILLGGTGKTTMETQREITEIEQTVLDTLFRILVHDLTEAWKSITAIDFSIQSVSTDPQFLQIMSPAEAVVAVRIEMRIGESAGFMNIAMPYLMIKMMRQKFDRRQATRKSESTAEDQGRVFDLIMPSRVTADVRLPKQQIRAQDLLALEPGDVLTFDMPVDSPVELVLNGRPCFRGSVVRAGQKRAFSVSEEICLG